MKTSITITLLLIFFGQVKSQSLINIPEDASTMSNAVQMALDGDTIYLSPGIYTDSVHIVNKHLVIVGEPGGTSILSPGPNGRSFELLNSEVEFVHLRFDDFDLETPPPNIGISASYSDVSIAHCEFRSMNTPVSLQWGDLQMHGSILSNTGFGKCILQNGGTFLLYNNLFYELSVTPISINRAHGAFFNNTVVGSTPTEYRGLIINSDSVSHFFNNIISGFGIGIHLIASDSAELAALRIYHNNIHDVLAPYWYEYNESLSLPIYSGALKPYPGVGEISVPPNFTEPDENDYSLHSTSQCIDAGIDAFSFSILYDLAGNERVIGPFPDIGAYEFESASTSLSSFGASQNEVVLYPNPARDYVWIEFADLFRGRIEILDASGKVLQSMQMTNESGKKVDLPLEKGLYFVRITSPESSGIKRVVKR